MVVTAAHCVDAGLYQFVFIGESLRGDDFAKGQVIGVAQVKKHPKYNPKTHENDIAVLLLADDVKNVRFPEFATPELMESAPGVRLAGFGAGKYAFVNGESEYTDAGIRRYIDVPLLNRACDGSGAEDFRCHRGREFVNGASLGRTNCKGDSGGPLYILDLPTKKWYLAGTTSRSLPPNKNDPRVCGDGAVNVLISEYADWIRSIDGGRWSSVQPN